MENNIQQLKSRYCRFVDTKEWTAFSDLLAPDAHLVFEGMNGEVLHEFFGRDEFVQMTAAFLAEAVTVHHIHNAEINLVSADKAECVWAMEDQIIFPEGSSAPFKVMHGYGHYYETLEKTGDQWQIKTLILKRLKHDFIN